MKPSWPIHQMGAPGTPQQRTTPPTAPRFLFSRCCSLLLTGLTKDMLNSNQLHHTSVKVTESHFLQWLQTAPQTCTWCRNLRARQAHLIHEFVKPRLGICCILCSTAAAQLWLQTVTLPGVRAKHGQPLGQTTQRYLSGHSAFQQLR